MKPVETIGVGTMDLGPETLSITVDPSLLLLLGLSEKLFRDDGNAVLDRIHPDDREQVLLAVLETTGPRRQRFRFDVDASGAHRWFEARLDLATGRPQCVVGIIMDVDHIVSTQDRLTVDLADLARSRSLHTAILASTPDAIHIYDVATASLSRALSSGPPLHDFTAESIAVLNGDGLEEFVPPGDRAQLGQALATAALLPDGESSSLRHKVVGHDGEVHWLRRRISILARDTDGRAITLVVVSSEITEIVLVEQRLKHAAEHDELTGLPNRRKFAAELDRRLANGRGVSVITWNLDGFRSINELHGREAGDAVLCAAARRLCAAVRANDMVARIGGDEFAMLISTEQSHASTTREDDLELTVDMHVDRIARRVEDLLAEPFHLFHAEIGLSASAGICLSRPDGDGTDNGAEKMISAANAAMDWVKRTGENGHYVFDQILQDELKSLEHTERNLRRALRDDALEVYYQPIVSPHTAAIRSVEALVRLRDEEGHMLPVDQVIAVAERCSLVAELDDQMLAKACRQVAVWRRDPRFSDLRLALNRSAKDLNRPGFHSRIMRRLNASELPAEALTLEITETVLLHVTSSRIDEMTRLHDSFVSLAIDDFGTGYASMSQLIALPISAIKIDRSFTARVLDDPICAALVSASVRIASDLGLSCVVEGVETIEQLRALPHYEHLLVQGYLYGRPRPAAEALDIAAVTVA